MSCAKWIKAPAAVLQGRIHIYSGPFMFMSLPKIVTTEWRQACALFMHFNARLWMQLPTVQCSAASQCSKYWLIYSVHRGFAQRQSAFQGQTWIKKTIHTLQTSWRLLSLQLNSPKQGLFFFLLIEEVLAVSAMRWSDSGKEFCQKYSTDTMISCQNLSAGMGGLSKYFNRKHVQKKRGWFPVMPDLNKSVNWG